MLGHRPEHQDCRLFIYAMEKSGKINIADDASKVSGKRAIGIE